MDFLITSCGEQDSLGWLLAIKTMNEKIGENVIEAKGIKENIIKGIFPNLNIQDDTVIEYFDGLLCVWREEENISLCHGEVYVSDLVAALSGQYIQDGKKCMAVPENWSVSGVSTNIDVCASVDGQMGKKCLLGKEFWDMDERKVCDKQVVVSDIVLNLRPICLLCFGITAQLMILLVYFFVFSVCQYAFHQAFFADHDCIPLARVKMTKIIKYFCTE